MVNKLEKAVLQGGMALGVFIDIKGAFDNLSTQAAIKGMKSHNFPARIDRMVLHYLLNRGSTVDISGVAIFRTWTRAPRKVVS